MVMHRLGVFAKAEESTELVGAPEIAERLGLARPQVVHNWRYRHADFPVPIVELRQGNVWYWPDIEEWLEATDRL